MMQLEIMQVNEFATIPPRNVLGVLKVGGMGAGRTLTIPATYENRFFF
jgi:hypothetical protein